MAYESFKVGDKYQKLEIVGKSETHMTFLCDCGEVFCVDNIRARFRMPMMCKECAKRAFRNNGQLEDAEIVIRSYTSTEEDMIASFKSRETITALNLKEMFTDVSIRNSLFLFFTAHIAPSSKSYVDATVNCERKGVHTRSMEVNYYRVDDITHLIETRMERKPDRGKGKTNPALWRVHHKDILKKLKDFKHARPGNTI